MTQIHWQFRGILETGRTVFFILIFCRAKSIQRRGSQ